MSRQRYSRWNTWFSLV